MQTLDIISVNLWQILISLVNLFLLFLILKHFLYAPVLAMLEKRRAIIDADFAAAEQDKLLAAQDRESLQLQLSEARQTADAIVAEATLTADQRGEKIVSEAQERAQGIIRRAEAEAAQELKKAEETIKQEIVDVSTMLTEKMLEREINEQDHRALIDDFIDNLDKDHDK